MRLYVSYNYVCIEYNCGNNMQKTKDKQRESRIYMCGSKDGTERT